MSILDCLPQVRGKYKCHWPLSNHVWFKTGGPAEVLFKPQDIQDLQLFLTQKPKDVQCTILGAGSNIIVRDNGIPGVVIKLAGPAFNAVHINGNCISVGAAVLDRTLAQICAQESVQGLEFLYGIPGTIGGAAKMNAGCYGGEFADLFVSCMAIDINGNIHNLNPKDMNFTYRSSSVHQDMFIVSAEVVGTQVNDNKQILNRMREIQTKRTNSQPTSGRTGGSTFKNPPNKKAWELIDSSDCRHLSVGGAKVSEKHCNFLINTGCASSLDLETLGEQIIYKTLEKHRISLEWEIKLLGK